MSLPRPAFQPTNCALRQRLRPTGRAVRPPAPATVRQFAASPTPSRIFRQDTGRPGRHVRSKFRLRAAPAGQGPGDRRWGGCPPPGRDRRRPRRRARARPGGAAACEADRATPKGERSQALGASLPTSPFQHARARRVRTADFRHSRSAWSAALDPLRRARAAAPGRARSRPETFAARPQPRAAEGHFRPLLYSIARRDSQSRQPSASTVPTFPPAEALDTGLGTA
jgi:hypothetical protein